MQTREAFGPPDILLRLSPENMLPGSEHLNPAVESAAVKQEIQFNERAKTKPERKKTWHGLREKGNQNENPDN